MRKKSERKERENEEGKEKFQEKKKQKQERSGRLRKGQKNKENKRKPKEQMLLFVHKKKLPRRARRGKRAPRRPGPQTREAGGAPPAPAFSRAGAEPDSELKFRSAGRMGVSALKGMVFVCGVSCWIQVWEGDEETENARLSLGHALGTWDFGDFLLWSQG